MRIVKIEATRAQIIIHFDGANGGRALVRETVPVIAEKQGRTLSIAEKEIANGVITLDRFEGKHDRLFSEFSVFMDNTRAEGVRYVTEVADDVPANRLPYPQPGTIKALGGTPEDIKLLGLKQTGMNVNLPAIMAAFPGDGTLPYEHDGKTYWFIKDRIDKLDSYMRELDELGLLVTFVLLNSPKHFEGTGESILQDACLHPGYDWSFPDAFISAFDMRTEEGQGYYRAFCEFLAERYSREDRKYGRAGGFIISNEVDAQYIWGNAGDMTVEDYTREYTQALRLAWLCARKHCSYLRVYASLDQLWGASFDPTKPLRFYPVRKVLDCIGDYCARDGNIPWHVAFHPYPEDLSWPDFWHDRSANFSFGTRKITFRNMEVLPAYLAQERFLYNGVPRRIIFSEQGFNSHSGPLQKLTEEMAEAGYVLAYLKARNIETCDMMTHHAYVDNPHEFGLNLGIRRFDPSQPHKAGERKPIYYAVLDMETEREQERIAKARAYIGEEIFDYLLDPPEIAGDVKADPNAGSDFSN